MFVQDDAKEAKTFVKLGDGGLKYGGPNILRNGWEKGTNPTRINHKLERYYSCLYLVI